MTIDFPACEMIPLSLSTIVPELIPLNSNIPEVDFKPGILIVTVQWLQLPRKRATGEITEHSTNIVLEFECG